jgi:hypothetical protein
LLLAATLAATAAALTGAAASGSATEQAVEPQGRLVYTMEHEEPPQCYSPPCDRSDDLEPGPQTDWIETARADGTDRRRLTPVRTGSRDGFCPSGQPRFLGTPRISPNGRLIAFPHCHKILLRDLQGHLVQKLSIPGDAVGLDWAPGGHRLAVQTYDGPGDKPRLYVVGRKHNHHRAIATEAASEVRWSPRRDLIAYLQVGTLHLVVVRPNGHVVHTIKREIDGFDFSPFDRRIAFPCREGACVERIDGTHRHVLTGRCVHDTLLTSVAWSPDGRWLACLRPRAVVVVDLRTDSFRVIRPLRRDETYEAAYDLDWGPPPQPAR